MQRGTIDNDPNDLYNTTDEKSLREEIINLEHLISDKKRRLFIARLCAFADIEPNKLPECNIANLQISVERDAWSVTYTHKTNHYHRCLYKPDDELDADESTQEPEIEYVEKESTVQFGRDKRKYIRADRANRFSLYTNSDDELRIINKDYDVLLDLEQQEVLIHRYSTNYDIPEWFAIRIFLFMEKNKWDDKDIQISLSIV